ncbi:MAG: pyroglutamyl-peptidase I, partial [Clostridia bacterium]|nr:pyroglutamyl-peptidase I [Clostridia bacterium]
MKKLLITGFDPFGAERVNPSWEAVSRLPDQIGDFCLIKKQLPTVFGIGRQLLSCDADAIICVGQ